MVTWFSVLKKSVFPNDRPNIEKYMLKPEVWQGEAKLDWKDGKPTIAEMEERLGRKLTKDDFALYAPLNWIEAIDQPIIFDIIGKEGIVEGIEQYIENPIKIIQKIPPEFQPKDVNIEEHYKKKIEQILNRLGINPIPYLEKIERTTYGDDIIRRSIKKPVDRAIDDLEDVADKYKLDEHDWSSVDDASDYLFEHKVKDENKT